MKISTATADTATMMFKNFVDDCEARGLTIEEVEDLRPKLREIFKTAAASAYIEHLDPEHDGELTKYLVTDLLSTDPEYYMDATTAQRQAAKKCVNEYIDKTVSGHKDYESIAKLAIALAKVF